MLLLLLLVLPVLLLRVLREKSAPSRMCALTLVVAIFANEFEHRKDPPTQGLVGLLQTGYLQWETDLLQLEMNRSLL
jgi:hypothetical protein